MPTNDEIEWKDCWKKPVKVQYKEITETAEIETREGKLYGYAGKDVLIKGVRGEVYPCKIDIFSDTYTTTAPLSEEQIRAAAAKRIDVILEKMETRADFFYKDATDLANKKYERGFFDGIHNARAKIKEIFED